MTVKKYVVLAILALGACANVLDETVTPAVLEGGFYGGESYEVRSRLLEGPKGTYRQTRVVYRGVARTCILDSPNDCESKARNLIDAYHEAIF